MDIFISDNNEEPIYLQIKNQIIKTIINGELKDGEQLPSLRNLAKDLRVSILTVNRAYAELEKDGFVFSVQGSGFFVGNTKSKIIIEQYLREIEEHFSEAVKLANIAGLKLTDLSQILNMIYKIELK